MASRDPKDLLPAVYARYVQFAQQLEVFAVNFLVTCVLRSAKEQDVLYAQGRTAPGNIVTWVRGGDSLHQYACAFDVVPLRYGKPLWSVLGQGGKLLPEWEAVRIAAELAGLEWAGNWRTHKEYAHLQYTGGLTLTDLKAGKEIK